MTGLAEFHLRASISANPMYTLSSATVGRLCLASVAIIIAPRAAAAQDPVKLPGVVIKAAPNGPGPRLMTGVVRDTAEFTLEGAEVSIAKLQRRTFARADGTFGFDDIAPGKYSVRAKKIGYAPQVRTIEVDSLGGIGVFELLPLSRALPAVVTSAARGGLSGVIADTSYNALPAVEIRVMGKGMAAETDSSGAFFIPVPAGAYIVTIRKEGFADKVVGVTIPSDSGRYLTASLQPSSGPKPVREAWNLADLTSRLAMRNKQLTSFYTREDLKSFGIEWVYDAVRMGGQDQYDTDCKVIVDGGPGTTDLGTLTIDDVESVEIYGSSRARAPSAGTSARPAGIGQRKAGVSRPRPITSSSNEGRANFQNQSRFCPEAIYVWLR
jgi:hypothetical protein